MIQDLRYSLRTLRRNPGFAAVAVATLALGIGANSAIFSVVHAVLLRPLPYPESGRLVFLYGQDARRGIPMHFFLYPDFVTWREASGSYQSAAAFTRGAAVVTAADGKAAPERVETLRVNASYLRVLQVRPMLGRGFLDREDSPGAPPTAILSHGLWQRRFASDGAIVGRAIVLDGVPHTIAGVLPPGFRSLNAETDVYVPLALPPTGAAVVGAIARLRPGATLAQAQAETAAIVPRLNPRFFGASGRSLRLWGAREFMVRQVERSLLVLMGAVGLVLLIACANVANLLLARAGTRRREMAVRAALGAGRWRVARQLLTESIVLGLAGAAGGLAAAFWGVRLLVALAPARYPLIDTARLDWPVLAFTLAASLLTAVLFGLAPAVAASRAGLYEGLKEDGRSGLESRGRNRLRRALVVVEVALALVLAIGAGLLMKSFGRLLEVDPGFNPRNLLAAGINLPAACYGNPHHRMAFFAGFLDEISTAPGVQAAGLVNNLPFSGTSQGCTMRVEGRPLVRPEDAVPVRYRIATPGYFSAMEIPLRRGRLLSGRDAPDAPLAAVVNEALVRRFFPNEDPIGKRIAWDANPAPPPPGRPAPPWITIVGVVGSVRHLSLAGEPEPEIYLAYTQQPVTAMEVAVRAAGGPERMAPLLRAAAAAADPGQVLSEVRTIERMMGDSLAERRLAVWLLGAFAELAILLAAVGIYGVLSYTVARRTREIGVRLALGADPAGVRRMILGETMRLAGAGLAAGVLAAVAFTPFLRGILYGVSAADPAVFGAVVLLLAAVAAGAGYLPARRATRVDPAIALRCE